MIKEEERGSRIIRGLIGWGVEEICNNRKIEIIINVEEEIRDSVH